MKYDIKLIYSFFGYNDISNVVVKQTYHVKDVSCARLIYIYVINYYMVILSIVWGLHKIS